MFSCSCTQVFEIDTIKNPRSVSSLVNHELLLELAEFELIKFKCVSRIRLIHPSLVLMIK